MGWNEMKLLCESVLYLRGDTKIRKIFYCANKDMIYEIAFIVKSTSSIIKWFGYEQKYERRIEIYPSLATYDLDKRDWKEVMRYGQKNRICEIKIYPTQNDIENNNIRDSFTRWYDIDDCSLILEDVNPFITDRLCEFDYLSVLFMNI